jgi:hypothetical protein
MHSSDKNITELLLNNNANINMQNHVSIYISSCFINYIYNNMFH